jgi:Zn-dependent protease with chaperone function
MRRCLAIVATLLALAGCAVPPPTPPPVVDGVAVDMGGVARAVDTVVGRIAPVAEQECRRRRQDARCELRIFVDTNPEAPPNAFQTLDRRDRPVIVVSLPLILQTENADELAFILGHEAGHHIAGHIPRTRVNAEIGAQVLAGLAEADGRGAGDVERARELGAMLGARRFAKEFELEADVIGTVIAARAGYDPVRGARFFARIPDPGDRFLGTHPPNAERQEAVRRTAARLAASGGG